TIDGTLNIVSSDFSVFSNNYQLTASGTASTGSYSGGTFSGLDFGTGSITFSIRPIDTSDCTTDSPVCTGTANLST
uniref:hypothetical protein n=1 Tax=Klebsiella pneumoniae TaxID=573 RepID=UPI0025A24CDB